MNARKKMQRAEQIRRALQMFVQSLPDEAALEVATVYPKYKVGKNYKTDEIFSYGENGVGDPQLYRVEMDHTSQEDWKPDENRALYTTIGLTDDGVPIWSRPTGYHDAYNIGDVVEFNGTRYKSLVNGNTFSPEENPQGWEIVEE